MFFCKIKRKLILAEADEFMEAYDDGAYWKARAAARECRNPGDHPRDKFLAKVRIEIAKRTDFEIVVDTATRYLESEQAPYNPRPGIVRPDGVTLH